MAKLLKLRRGTTTQHGSFTGAEGEVTIDTTKDTAVVHDGAQAGGRPLAREDMSNVSSASIAGRLSNDSIATDKIASGALPTDVTIVSANITNGSIVNADIASNAAIEGTKLENSGVTAGSYGSSSAIPIVTVDAQGLVTAASTTAIDSTTIANGTSNVAVANNGNITATRSGTARLVVDDAGVDVTGALTVSTSATVSQLLNANGGLTIENSDPRINLVDTDGNPDYHIRNNGGSLIIRNTTNGVNNFVINGAGEISTGSNVDVTGNITVSGTVDGVDVAALKTSKDSLSTSNGIIKSGVELASGVITSTQSAGDNSTKVATTEYTDTAIANLVDSSPSALNTLNELAAAINDDANFSSTVNTNIAAKLPKTGGVMSGDIGFGDNNKITMGGGLDLSIYHDGNHSRIVDTKNAVLSIQSSAGTVIHNAAANEYMAKFMENGACELYHDNNKKIETTSTGATVTGTCTATAFAGDGSALTGIVSIPSGMIMIWSGAANAIPSGFVLCNGSNSTPDLRDRFIVGAQNSYSVGATGGSTTDNISVSVSGSDTVSFNQDVYSDGSIYHYGIGANYNYETLAGRYNQSYGNRRSRVKVSLSLSDTVNISGSGSATVDTLPPYYALCYVMKT